MTRLPRGGLPIVLLAAACCGGCLTVYSRNVTVGGDEGRATVHFETPHAESTFCREMKRHAPPTEHTHVGVPFVTLYSCSKSWSKDAVFNREVRRCDANGDGVVTEVEAAAYAGQPPPPPSPPPAPPGPDLP
jgi:hypothetical protein